MRDRTQELPLTKKVEISTAAPSNGKTTNIPTIASEREHINGAATCDVGNRTSQNLPAVVDHVDGDEQAEPLRATAGPDDFDWSSTNTDLVAPCQPATAIYQNPYGQIVIRQESREYGEDDPFVFISPEYLADVIARLEAMRRQ